MTMKNETVARERAQRWILPWAYLMALSTVATVTGCATPPTRSDSPDAKRESQPTRQAAVEAPPPPPPAPTESAPAHAAPHDAHSSSHDAHSSSATPPAGEARTVIAPDAPTRPRFEEIKPEPTPTRGVEPKEAEKASLPIPVPGAQQPAPKRAIEPPAKPTSKEPLAKSTSREPPPEAARRPVLPEAKAAKPDPQSTPPATPPDADKPRAGIDQLALRPEAATPEPATKSGPSAGERLSLTLESLPISFGAIWQLDRAPNPVTGKTQCLLSSKAQNIFDGYEKTNVQIYIAADGVYVRTDSNVDLSYPETGLRVDQGRLRPFDRVIKKNHVALTSDLGSVFANLGSAREVTVRLGFWPTWPVTSTREINFRLEHFADAIQALRACDKM